MQRSGDTPVMRIAPDIVPDTTYTVAFVHIALTNFEIYLKKNPESAAQGGTIFPRTRAAKTRKSVLPVTRIEKKQNV